MRGSKKAGPVKRRVMRGGGMAKKAGPVKKKAMRSGGRSAADSEKAKDAHSRSSHKYFAGASQTVNNQMVKAVLVTVLCCLPFGIVAIIKSSEVNGKLAVGDIVGAQMSASSSSNWSNMAIIFGLIFGIFYFFILMADILYYL